MKQALSRALGTLGRIPIGLRVVLRVALLFFSVHATSHAAILKVNIFDNSCNDTTGNPCFETVAAAMTAAVDGDEILIAPGSYPTNIKLDTGKAATATITITGSGPDQTFIDGSNATRIMIINHSLIVSNLTMRNGNAPSSNSAGGAIYMYALSDIATSRSLTIDNVVFKNNSARKGGAIATAGRVSVNIHNTHISGNSVTEEGGAIHYGLAANANQSLTIRNSSLVNNSVTSNSADGLGGALYNEGLAYLINTTISGNSATFSTGSSVAQGGAVYNHNNGSLSLHNTTVSNNQTNGTSAGLYNLGTLTLQNSILADNNNAATESNCGGMSNITSNGYNLFGDPAGCSIVMTDISNATAAQLGLAVLKDNGGPAHTHALTATSSALNAGNPSACTDHLSATITVDQRGAPRSGRCDIGAYEVAKEILVYPSQGLITTELGNNTIVRIALAAQPNPGTTVQLSALSTNTNEISVTPSAMTFTDSNWDTVQTFTLNGVNDNILDSDQAVQIQINSTSGDTVYNNINKNVSASNWHVANITTPDFIVSPPQDLITTEQNLSANFGITLASAPGNQVAITAVITSNADEALIASTVPVLFNNTNWNRQQTVTIQGLDDQIIDGNISYQVQFSLDRNNTDDDLYLNANIAPQSFTLTNIDNETSDGGTAGVTIGAPTPSNTTSELQNSVSFTVRLNSMPSADVILNPVSNNPDEGIVTSPPPMFTPANWSTPQTITVQGVDENFVDGDKIYSILFDRPDTTDPIYGYIIIDSVRLINNDNEVAGLSVNAASNLTTSETGTSVSFSAQLTAPPQPGAVVILTTQHDSSEHSVSPSQLSFDSNNWNTAQSFTVTGQDDMIRDGTITDLIQVVVAANSTSAPYINARLSHTVSIDNTDNETGSIIPGITVSEISNPNTTEAGGTVTFTVVLATQPGANVMLNLSSSDAGEGQVSPNSLTFTDQDWYIPQQVTVTGIDDTLVDDDVNYFINFAPSSSADSSYNNIVLTPIALTNINNDLNPGVTIHLSNPSGLVTSESGGSETFWLSLTTQPANTVTVTITSSNTREGTVPSRHISFLTSEWNPDQRIAVTVTGVDDNRQDGDTAYSIQVSTSSGDPDYNLLAIADIPAINRDNDSNTDSGGGALSSFYLILLALLACIHYFCFRREFNHNN